MGTSTSPGLIRHGVPVAVLLAVGAIAYWLHGVPGRGPAASFAVLSGAAFGVLLQRSRFCFYCNLADWFGKRESQGVLALLAALAAGTVGYLVVFGAWVPAPLGGKLPPDAHIGPVSWALPAAGLAFGLGMALSGSCISAHLYRLGEGSLRAPFALVGALVGFGLGFMTWQRLYLAAIQEAPVLWLPRYLGYAGAGLLQLAALGALAWWIWRRRAQAPAAVSEGHPVWERRWPGWIGGVAIGVLGMWAFLRTGPLGVTSQLGSLARRGADALGLTEGRLPGLDTFAGCATRVGEFLVSGNGLFVLALIAGAFAAAVRAGQFQPSRQPPLRYLTAFLGGVLMGWGAMTGLGCTIGTVLSGISALSVSGWVFAAAVVAGVWGGDRALARASRPS